jgi:thiamine-monophosphate kinase
MQLYEGILPLARQFDLALAGGDTNCWEGPLVINITALGQVTEKGPLLRGGASPGDSIVVTGDFGGSILGRHYDFQPRVSEALLLHDQYAIHAGIDVSDGLSLDLSRICQESGCGAVVQLDRVPVSPDAERLAGQEPGKADRDAALRHALADGEDFELVLAVPRGEDERMLADQPLSVPLTRIGYFIAESGIWQQRRDGERRPLAPRGFQHGITGCA